MTDQPCNPSHSLEPAPNVEPRSTTLTTSVVAPSAATPCASGASGKPSIKTSKPKRKPKRRKAKKPAKAKNLPASPRVKGAFGSAQQAQTSLAEAPCGDNAIAAQTTSPAGPGQTGGHPSTHDKPIDTQAQPEALAGEVRGANEGIPESKPRSDTVAQAPGEVLPESGPTPPQAPQPPQPNPAVAPERIRLRWDRKADPRTHDPRLLRYLPYFTWHLCGLRPYPVQEAVLHDLNANNSDVAACCANGVGKTSIIAASAVLWHALCFRNSVTITTSGVFRQVKEQMWPQIRRLAQEFKGLVDIDLNQTDFSVPSQGSRVVGFSTDDPGKFEGWHAESLMLVYDEAKTIPDAIFEAGERCKQGQPVRVLMLSSPGGTQGTFYDAIEGKQKHLWKRHRIRADQCPHIKPEAIQRTIERYGEQHPLVRSMIYAEFMDIGENTLVFPRSVVNRCIASPPQPTGTERVAFCDFAAGGDENVFALRHGNRLVEVVSWVERNTMAAVGRFLQLFRKHGLQPGQVFGDGSGLGIPMCDAINEAGFEIVRVNNGTPAKDDHLYANRGAEMWFTVATNMDKLEISLGQFSGNERLLDQLCTRKSKVDAKGRLALESKDEMRKRGLPSPDRADAVIGAFANTSNALSRIVHFSHGQSLSELLDTQVQQDQMAGFDAGY